MAVEIIIPFDFGKLKAKPDFLPASRISDDMQQSLSSLVGFDSTSRQLLRCSKGGVFYTTSPRIKDIFHVEADAGNYNWQGSDIEVTEIMVMGHPYNTGIVWVKNDEVATTNNGWPLAAKEVIGITVENLNNLYLLIATQEEKAIIAYTR